MQQRPAPEKNITSQVSCRSPWRLRSVIPLKDFQLSVEFYDGLSGVVCMREKILGSSPGVFRELKDVALFNQVFLQYGVVTWPGELDLAPDAMYDDIKKTGQYILT